MWRMKAFVLFLLLVFGSSISSGRYIEDTSDQTEEDRDLAERSTEAEGRDAEDEDDEEEDPNYTEDEDNDEHEHRDAREEVVHIPGQSPDEREQEEAEDNEEDDENEEFEHEEKLVDELQDDRMMDGDEGGVSLAGQEDVSEQTDFEGFKRKVEEIAKTNENMQAEINKLKTEFDEVLSSDSKSGVPDTSVESKSTILHDTSYIHSSEELKGAGVQHRTYSDDDLVRRYSEIGEDADIAPDDDY